MEKIYDLYKMMKPVFVMVMLSLLSCSIPTTRQAEQQIAFLPLVVEKEVIEEFTLKARKLTELLYESNDFHFLWIDSTGLKSNADSLLQLINTANAFGLFSDDYHREELSQLLKTGITSHESATVIDILFTDAWSSMFLHVKHGRLENALNRKRNFSNYVNQEDKTEIYKAIRNADLRDALIKLSNPEVRLLYYELARLSSIETDSVNQKKMNQVIATIERLKVDEPRPDYHILVNIPSFLLRVVENDSMMLETKVIVGKPETPTPVYRSVIKHFIIYPYWHVPKSILKEILPSIQADSLYMRRNNYEVIDSKGNVLKPSSIKWLDFTPENFPYILRQREGSENTMGVIKFVFQNPYNVFLHDTNARRLFGKTDRALSHGCIRVHKAVDLAKYLIKDDYIVSPDDLEQYMEMQHRMDVRLPRAVAVLLLYFTVEVKAGKVIYYDDIYQLDKQVLNVLKGVDQPSV